MKHVRLSHYSRMRIVSRDSIFVPRSCSCTIFCGEPASCGERGIPRDAKTLVATITCPSSPGKVYQWFTDMVDVFNAGSKMPKIDLAFVVATFALDFRGNKSHVAVYTSNFMVTRGIIENIRGQRFVLRCFICILKYTIFQICSGYSPGVGQAFIKGYEDVLPRSRLQAMMEECHCPNRHQQRHPIKRRRHLELCTVSPS